MTVTGILNTTRKGTYDPYRHIHINFKPQMTDFHELDCLFGGDNRTETYEETTGFGYSNTVLKDHNVFTKEIEDLLRFRKRTPKDIKFIKYQKSLKSAIEIALNRVEKRYIAHVMLKQYKNDPGIKEHMNKLLQADPVGIAEPSKDDPFCWTANTVLTAVDTEQSGDEGAADAAASTTRRTRSATSADTEPLPAAAQQQPIVTTTEYKHTDFQVRLKHAQKQIYLHLRATITGKFAEENAKNLIEGFIDDQETERRNNGSMTEDNRFQVGIRVEWNEIKEYVYDKICITRMGSHHFLSLFTTMRDDNQTVVQWIKAFEGLQKAISKQSLHWKAIVDEEIVPALSIWLTNNEQEAIMQQIFKKDLHNTYKSFEALTRTMTLKEFRKLIQSMEPKAWPKRFSQQRHRNALAQTLIPYKKHEEALKAALAKLEKENTDLKTKLNRANEKIRNLQKKTNTNGKTPTAAAPPTPKPTPPNKGKGKEAPKGCCQKCWDFGLGARKHRTEDCDDKKREAAVAKKAERLAKRAAKANNNTAASQSNKNAQNSKKDAICLKVTENRKWDWGEYADEHCKWCKNEDVEPGYCTHDAKDCFRRPGGPLEGITDPKLRTTKSKQLAAQKVKEYKDKKKAAAATRKAKRKKKKVGFSSQSIAITKAKPATKADPRDAFIPPGKHTAEELAKKKPEDWSEPSSTYKNRYLLNKIAKKAPLTYNELDTLMPKNQRESKRHVDMVKYEFHGIKGEHKLRAFRKDQYGFLIRHGYLFANGGSNYGYSNIDEVDQHGDPLPKTKPKKRRSKSKAKKRSSAVTLSSSAAYEPKLPAGGKAKAHAPPPKRKPDYEPMGTQYTATSPHYVPTSKKSRVENKDPPPIVVE